MSRYEYPRWPAPAHVKACMTTRNDGHSVAPYASFNLAAHVGDNPEHVRQNRQQLMCDLALPASPVWLTQVHGNKVLPAETTPAGSEADAAFATSAGVVCVVQTADCLPILLCDTQGQMIAAVHAGWRGLSAGIIENTLVHFSVSPENVLVWLGAAIGAQAFEVGEDVRAVFMANSVQAAQAFQPVANGKYLADIYLLARQRLQAQGIRHIFGGNYCTFTQADRYYSYRREKVTGRMASLIWLADRDYPP